MTIYSNHIIGFDRLPSRRFKTSTSLCRSEAIDIEIDVFSYVFMPYSLLQCTQTFFVRNMDLIFLSSVIFHRLQKSFSPNHIRKWMQSCMYNQNIVETKKDKQTEWYSKLSANLELSILLIFLQGAVNSLMAIKNHDMESIFKSYYEIWKNSIKMVQNFNLHVMF